jgi:hypothetical protein
MAVVAGCGFSHGTAGPGDATGVDAADAPAIDMQIDTSVGPYCDPADSHLVACYEFQGNTLDASGHNLNATMTNVAFVPGKVGLAMQFDTTSAADVAESPLFDVAAVTIEAWIYPTAIPDIGLRAGILDNDPQYGVFLHENGRLQCTISGVVAQQIDAQIAANTWTHVACTYDGSTMTIYINGVMRFQGGGAGTINTGGTSGVSIAADNPPGSGSQLVGLIDEVRVLDRARTATEICFDAQCP